MREETAPGVIFRKSAERFDLEKNCLLTGFLKQAVSDLDSILTAAIVPDFHRILHNALQLCSL